MMLPTLNIKAAIESPPPALDFVLPGLLAGTTGMLVGPGGAGKTTLLMQLALSLATGLPFGLAPLQANAAPARVVFLAAEESAEILQVRLHRLFSRQLQGQAELSNLAQGESAAELLQKNLVLIPGAGYSIPLLREGERTEFFSSFLATCTDARLVIIDPLRRLHDGDENSSAAMTEVVQALESLGRKSRAAVLVAHHMNKGATFNASPDSAGAARGSSALTDAVRWQANLVGMTEAEATKFRLSGNHRSYARLDFTKTNYLAPADTCWLKRGTTGELEHVALRKRPSKAVDESRFDMIGTGGTYV